MSTNTVVGTESRVLKEGYGPGAWHGADLKAALADVTPALAFWRPGPGRHNIAEIALHHAYYARVVRERISLASLPVRRIARAASRIFLYSASDR